MIFLECSTTLKTKTTKQTVSIDIKLKKTNETRNYLSKEIKHNNDLMSKKYKKVCKVFSYFENFLVFVSAVSGWISVSPFASSIDVAVGIANFEVGIKICAIPTGINTYKSVIMEKKKKHDQIMLLAKSKLNTVADCF